MKVNYEKIKRARKEKGLTQKQLSELCGINEAQLRRYETGKGNPKIETLTKIANALDLWVVELSSDIEEDYMGDIVESVKPTGIERQAERNWGIHNLMKASGYIVKQDFIEKEDSDEFPDIVYTVLSRDRKSKVVLTEEELNEMSLEVSQYLAYLLWKKRRTQEEK